jgi:hypothetical protein
MTKNISRAVLSSAVVVGILATYLMNATVPNLVANGNFEQGFYSANGGVVPNEWKNFYCDTPYTPAKCPALRRDIQSPPRSGSNDPGLLMGLPEWKDTSLPERTRAGHASQFFSAYRVHDAGLYQTIKTIPGQVCYYTAYVMSWAADKDRGTNGVLWTSDTLTEDDKDSAVWRLGVASGTDVYAFSQAVKWGRKWTYEDGHYDHYIALSYSFVAESTETTIFIRQVMLWPFAHNEGYVDDVSVQCVNPATPLPTLPITPVQDLKLV